MIIVLDKPATADDIEKARQEYKSYIKVTLDIVREIVAIGGEYHFDAEQKLLEMGSRQTDIWGGGVDLTTKNIDTNAMINIRPRENESTEIMKPDIRDKVTAIIRRYLPGYAA